VAPQAHAEVTTYVDQVAGVAEPAATHVEQLNAVLAKVAAVEAELARLAGLRWDGDQWWFAVDAVTAVPAGLAERIGLTDLV